MGTGVDAQCNVHDKSSFELFVKFFELRARCNLLEAGILLL